jgi:multidrug resistance efflux pump
MKHIRKRPRLDQLLNEQRSMSSSWGRRVYLALLAILALTIADYLVGDAFVLSADGILLSDRTVVDAMYPARVAEVFVREGDSVERGALLMKLVSTDMQREIADLSARDAELATRQAQLRVDQSRISALLPLAERWSHDATESVTRFDTISSKGLISAQTQNQAQVARYDAAAKRAELQGQSTVLAAEVPEVERSSARAHDALADLEALYANGEVRAASAGVIGPRVPDVGHVARTGDELMLLYGGKRYILAYLPELYMFSISRGDKVAVTAGPGAPPVTGVVDALLDVADALPPEFQSNFRPRDRDRLIRIALPEAPSFALSQKVRVGGCALGWCWRNAASSWLGGALDRLMSHWPTF